MNNRNKIYTENWIAKQQEKKALTRRRRSVAQMSAYPGQFRCKACIHGKTDNCQDNLPNGCEYYYNAASGREFQVAS